MTKRLSGLLDDAGLPVRGVDGGSDPLMAGFVDGGDPDQAAAQNHVHPGGSDGPFRLVGRAAVTMTGDVTDLDTTWPMILLDPDGADREVRGIDRGEGPGSIIWLYNAEPTNGAGGAVITLHHQDAGAAEPRRIVTPDGLDYMLRPGAGVLLWRDEPTPGADSGRWRFFLPAIHHTHEDALYGYGQVAHDDLTSVGANDHHDESHTHDGDGSGTITAAAVSFAPAGTIAATNVQAAIEEAAAEAAGAPTGADYLVGTAHAGLSAEIVVGTSPGGELGGTWASPTVDATHSGSTHAAAQAAAEATAAAALSGHEADTSDVHAHSSLSGIGATDHHAAPAAGPDANAAIDTAGAAGTASTFARSGHGHQVTTTDAPSGAVVTIDAAPSAGATGAIARATHGHRLNTYSSAAAASGTPAAGTSAAAPSRGDHVHAIDLAIAFSKAGVLTTGTGAFRWYNDTGVTLTFVKARASVGTAPTGATILVDLHKGGTTIWATQSRRLTIAISGNTDTQTAFDTTTIADGEYLTVDVDQVGSTIAGSDLVVQLFMRAA